jgi:prevent-host-death family protein
MKRVSLYEAKTHLSALVEDAAAGAEIIIAKNGKARAKLVRLADTDSATARGPRFGFWDHYNWSPPDDFDEPDAEIEAMFYGDDEPDA